MMNKYRLGDIVDVISEREDNPANCEYDKFVGLEHYVSGDVEINSYGKTDLLASAMKIFKAGDILIARRNVYLRRASVVNFDGITSGDSIVLRTKEEVMKKLLPFVLNTDNFWEYADKFSDGTMSKRLSPKLLLEYEFNLPDIKEQEKLAELLWAANDTKEAYKKLLALTDDLVKAQFVEMFGDPYKNPFNWEKASVEEWAQRKVIERPMDGNHGEKHPKASDYVISGVPFVMANNLADGKVDYAFCNYITEIQAKSLDKGFSIFGDVLITHKGTIGRTAIVGNEFNFIMLTPQVTYYRILKGLNNRYLKSYFDSDYFQSEIFKIAGSGTTRAYIGITAQNKLPMIVPPIELQDQFSDFVKQTDKSKLALQQTISSLENTITSLMQQYTG